MTKMHTIIPSVRSEPAAYIGLLVSVLSLFQGGASWTDAVPAAVGLVIRFFVTPAV